MSDVFDEAALYRVLFSDTEEQSTNKDSLVKQANEFEHSITVPVSSSIQQAIYEQVNKQSQTDKELLGFPFLDRFMVKDSAFITVVVGAPGSGKSTLAINIAMSMALRGKKVYYFTFDLTRQQVIGDILKSQYYDTLFYEPDFELSKWNLMCNTDEDVLFYDRLNKLTEDEELVLEHSKHKIEQCLKTLYVIDGNSLVSIDTITNLAKELNAKGETATFIIDYLQAVHNNKGLLDKQKADYASQCLHIIKSCNISVIALSSTNKNSYNDPSFKIYQHKMFSTNLSISSPKESGEIEFSADTMFGVEKVSRQGNPDRIGVTVLKSRVGKAGEQHIFDTNFMFKHVKE